jgi:hypothetical protein
VVVLGHVSFSSPIILCEFLGLLLTFCFRHAAHAEILRDISGGFESPNIRRTVSTPTAIGDGAEMRVGEGERFASCGREAE